MTKRRQWEPAFQNIPVHSAEGRKTRSIFADATVRLLAHVDFAELERRMSAALITTPNPEAYQVIEYLQDADSWGCRLRALFSFDNRWGTADLLIGTDRGVGYPTDKGVRTIGEVLAADHDLLDWHESEEHAREHWSQLRMKGW